MHPMFVPPNTDSGTTTRMRTSAIQSRRTVCCWMSKAAPPVSADHAVLPPVPPVHPARHDGPGHRPHRLPRPLPAAMLRLTVGRPARPSGPCRPHLVPRLADWVGWHAHVDGCLGRGGRVRGRLRPDRVRPLGPDADRDGRGPPRRPPRHHRPGGGVRRRRPQRHLPPRGDDGDRVGPRADRLLRLARDPVGDALARPPDPAAPDPVRRHRGRVRLHRQRDDRRPDDADHPLGRQAPGHLPGSRT